MKCCAWANLKMAVATIAIFGRGGEAGHLLAFKARQLPAAPTNSSLRDILMAGDCSTFEQPQAEAKFKSTAEFILYSERIEPYKITLLGRWGPYCDGDLSSGFNSLTMNQ